MKFSLCGKRYQHLLKCQAPREWELRQFASEARTPRRRQAGRGRELREPCMPVGGSDRVRMSRGSPEMSFSGDSKSSVRKHMRVQVPPSAPKFPPTVLRFVAPMTLAVKSPERLSKLTFAELWLF